MQEFAPLEHFNRILHLWWIILVTALIGGLVGFLFSRAHSPVYEASAIFSVNIDLNKVPEHPLQLQDEDLALYSTRSVLFSPGITDAVLANAAKMGYTMDTTQLLASSSIERQHVLWVLRFRSSNPVFAQTLVNQWAEAGYQAMLEWQSADQIPAYVIFSPPTLSGLPREPVHFDTNKLILWGSLAGCLAGILLIEFIANRPNPANIA